MQKTKRRISVQCGRAATSALLLILTGCAAQRHHYAGMAEMDKQHYPEAVEELQQAAAMQPADVEYQRDWLRNREVATNALLARAEAARQRGNPSESASDYQTILKYDPFNARALLGLEALTDAGRSTADIKRAKTAQKRGDNEEALRFLKQALDRTPDSAEAHILREEIETTQGDGLPQLPSLGTLYRKPVNLEFRDASVRMVFDTLSRTTGINFIFDRDVKPDQRTTVFLKQTAFEDAIDVILSTNQLEKKVLNATSVLIYPNTAAKLKEYQDLLVKAFYLSNVDAKTTAAMLKSVLKLKDVFVDEKSHMIVLRENADSIALAEKLIALQDLEDPEVMLEVEVLEVNRSRLLNLGIQLTNQLTISPLNVASSGSNASASDTLNLKLSDLLHLNADKLGVTVPSVTLSLQKTDGDANLLANPRLRVRDREKAKIMIGDKVPVVTTTATPNGFVSENVQYLDVGLKLDVEPEVHLHNEVSLKLGLEVSSIVASVKTASGSQAYQIGTRNINTSLRLRDGETQVLAGLISDADRSDANRIPLLGDIPVLGRLFSSQKDDRQKTEIVMSITPHLIRNIQRRSPAAEAFWSGTEATLRTKPVQLGTLSAEPAGAGPKNATVSNPTPIASVSATDLSGLGLAWNGPRQAKVGQPIVLELTIDTKHKLRATPLQLAYNPAAFEVLSVQAGDFFARAGAGQFSQTVDKASGRISVGLAAGDQKAGSGAGTLVRVELRPLSAVADSEIAVSGLTPVGTAEALSAPSLPLSTRVTIEP